MANDIIKMVDRWVTPLAPIVLGAVLINNTALILLAPVLLHQVVGWAFVALGVVKYFNNN